MVKGDLAVKIVLKTDSEKFELAFLKACEEAHVHAFLSDEAAEGFSEYELVGGVDSIGELIDRFGL